MGGKSTARDGERQPHDGRLVCGPTVTMHSRRSGQSGDIQRDPSRSGRRRRRRADNSPRALPGTPQSERENEIKPGFVWGSTRYYYKKLPPPFLAVGRHSLLFFFRFFFVSVSFCIGFRMSFRSFPWCLSRFLVFTFVD